MKKIICIFAIYLLSSQAAFSEGKGLEEKEGELLDFQSIKSVLKNDGLDSNAKKKQGKYTKAKKTRVIKKRKMFDLPNNDSYWGFMTELWLVKNAPIIKWDFQKPEYGLEQSLELFFERMGIYEQSFKILLVNTPNISHYALPGSGNEIIFLLSQPFIRTLDLSKLEISILLYEDYTRLKMGFFMKRVQSDKLMKSLGGNFEGKKLELSIFNKTLEQYDSAILEKGFSFNDQFAVTKRIGDIFKSDMKLWNSYLNLLKKVNELIQTNLLYSKYNDIYPSPELQIGWLTPKRKGL